MDKIGISFRARLSADDVRVKYIEPLRSVLGEVNAGIYVNYLRQADTDTNEPTEHLLIFEVNDFKESLRFMRVQLEEIGIPEGMQFQNLNPSSPSY